MDEQNIPENPGKNGKRIISNKMIIYSILIVLWIGIVYSAYIYAKNYLDTAIANIRQDNAMNITEIREDLTILSTEIKNLRTSMEDTGVVISGTSDVQSRIDEKLLNLESQLQELKKSLEILKEAPDAES
jgi:peptidoglycan hydrolase CwlO-like protein